MSVDVQKIKEQVLQYSDQIERVRAEVRKVLVGQDAMLSRLLIALLTGGHVLLEGLPGLAKTTAIKALAGAIQCKFNRIQFTPDLLPADLLGTMIYNPREGSFGTRKGPIMLKVIVGYPSKAEEHKVVDAVLDDIRREVQPVMSPVQLFEIKRVVSSIYMDDKVKDYVLDVVAATRRPEEFRLKELKPLIQCGASPRASINLCLATRANAFLVGRGYVTPQDVKDIAFEILRHRIILTYEAEAEEMTSDDIVRKVLESVPVP